MNHRFDIFQKSSISTKNTVEACDIFTLPSARYYNSDLSIWLSVDPLADKYPNLSPYTYCAGNPVRLVDPDGRAPWDPTNVKQARQFAKSNNGKLRIVETSNGKMAFVTRGIVINGWEGVEIRAFNPTNDSWAQKSTNFFQKIVSYMSGGIRETAENGQNGEIRIGTGDNPTTDVTPYISDVPTPIETSSSNSINYRVDSEKNNSVTGTTGTIHVEEEVKAWNSGPFQLKYSGSDDSAKKREQLNTWEKEFNTKYIIKETIDE